MRRISLFGLFGFLGFGLFFFLVSCSPGRINYTDRVKALDPKMASSKLTELFKHWTKADQPDDDLVRTWRAWLSDVGVPLVEKDVVTFVFYDFQHTANNAEIEANFAQGQPEPLVRFGKTPLFYKVYKIPKPNLIRYRFFAVLGDGSRWEVIDPFNPLAEPGPPAENKLPDLTVLAPQRNYISPAMEPALKGQKLVIHLPPDYLRNLSLSYPVLYLAGMPEGPWDKTLNQAYAAQSLAPLIVVNLVDSPSLGPVVLSNLIKSTVKPWVDLHYRTLSDKDDTLLFGWDKAASAAAQATSESRDTFGKTWSGVPPEANWDTQLVPVLNGFFPVDKP